MQWKPYRFDTKIEAAASVQTPSGPKVPEGFFLEVTQIAIVDITTSNKILALGYLDLTGEFRVFCENQGTNLNMHQLWGEQFIFAGEAPAGRITTPTAGDDCFFSVNGRLWPIELESIIDAEVQPEDSLPS